MNEENSSNWTRLVNEMMADIPFFLDFLNTLAYEEDAEMAVWEAQKIIDEGLNE